MVFTLGARIKNIDFQGGPGIDTLLQLEPLKNIRPMKMMLTVAFTIATSPILIRVYGTMVATVKSRTVFSTLNATSQRMFYLIKYSH